MEGHGKPCYYCGELCDGLAGNPSRWPIPLCHRNEPGRVKWHHIGCVTSRLIENCDADTLANELAKRKAEPSSVL
jgi:hypothetical protein